MRPKATASRNVDAPYATEKISATPKMKPPTMAPVILPRPPKISTARPLKPIITPIVGSIALKDKPTNTPAAAPKADAIITVTDIIIVGLIPKRAAVSVLIDTARIALPILVFLITILRISIKTIETPKPIICTMEILKAPKSIRPPI